MHCEEKLPSKKSVSVMENKRKGFETRGVAGTMGVKQSSE